MGLLDLLSVCVKRGASDLHLSSGLPPAIRVDGDIERLAAPPLESREVCALLAGIGPARDLGAAPLDEDFGFEVPGLARLRVNVFRQSRGLAAVFRILPDRVSALEELGMGAPFDRIAEAPRGLVLVTGATGSGKSTTLAAMVDHVNASRRGHILTLEDPIEFVHRPAGCVVSQRQVGRDTKSFADALRAALREDPDVILLGEMRDPETIRLALTAAETGHLVFATLHASSAPKAMDRIVDAFAPGEKEMIRTMLGESLRAVIAQVLVKRIGGGRAAAHEILLGTPAVANLIREHKIAQLHSAMQTSGAAGMRTLDQSLERLVADGVVEPDEARRNERFANGF